MTVSVQRADLVRALSSVAKVVKARNTIPILGNVLLQGEAGSLTVTGTDLDIHVSASAPADGDLGTTVDAKRLSDIARRLSGDTVTMEVKEGNLVVKSGRSRFTLPTLPVADFPSLDAGAPDVEFNVDFAALVAPVKFAMGAEATRFYLCGVNLHVEGDTALRAVATDGHRLAHNSAAMPEGLNSCFNVIVPSKTVGLVPAGNVDVSLSKNKVRFATADTIIVSKLIDASFPDYKRVIPANNDNVVTVDRKAMVDAVARAAAVASERGKGAKFTVAGDNIAIDMRTDDGTAHEDVPATYSGEPIEIGFNTMYASDVLAAAPGDDLRIALSDSGTPALFRGAGEWLGMVMPVRI